jgi:S1-C subfamily serine protease
MRIPALGVVVTTRQNNDGAEIVELMPGSVAELAGLRVGDVLNAVDETVIKTPMELAVELSNKPSGSKIKIGHTTRGYWQSETVLILAS